MYGITQGKHIYTAHIPQYLDIVVFARDARVWISCASCTLWIRYFHYFVRKAYKKTKSATIAMRVPASYRRNRHCMYSFCNTRFLHNSEMDDPCCNSLISCNWLGPFYARACIIFLWVFVYPYAIRQAAEYDRFILLTIDIVHVVFRRVKSKVKAREEVKRWNQKVKSKVKFKKDKCKDKSKDKIKVKNELKKKVKSEVKSKVKS